MNEKNSGKWDHHERYRNPNEKLSDWYEDVTILILVSNGKLQVLEAEHGRSYDRMFLKINVRKSKSRIFLEKIWSQR